MLLRRFLQKHAQKKVRVQVKNGNKYLESVAEFKFLGIAVTDQNCIQDVR